VTAIRRTAIVTGAARGIGAATARRLARDGLAVALVDLDIDEATRVAAEIIAADGDAIALRADVTSEADVTSVVGRVAAELGRPTVLVNNAGILRDNLLFRMSLDDWEAVMSVHLRGAFLMSRAVQAHMVDAGTGRIVSLSSVSALGNRGQANYAAAKAGLQGLTKTLALELGRFGITANAVAPGFIVTDMMAAAAEGLGVTLEEFQARIAADTAVRRVGQPDDVAAVVSFLVSDDAAFVSGQVIYVAGGPTV
jgi:3-oxoacyl-[acyl-carrier protein] reductase